MRLCVLVPLDRRADNADKGECDARLPVLRRLEDEIVQRLTDLCVLAVERCERNGATMSGFGRRRRQSGHGFR